jgi:hypothetical protein
VTSEPGRCLQEEEQAGCTTEKLTVKGVVSDDEQSRGRKGGLVLLGYLRDELKKHLNFFRKRRRKKAACGTRRTVTANAITLLEGKLASTDQVHVIVMAP